MPRRLYDNDEARRAAARAAAKRCYQNRVNEQRVAAGLPPRDFGTRRPAYASEVERREARRLDKQRWRDRVRVAQGLPPAVHRNGESGVRKPTAAEIAAAAFFAFSIPAAHARLAITWPLSEAAQKRAADEDASPHGGRRAGAGRPKGKASPPKPLRRVDPVRAAAAAKTWATRRAAKAAREAKFEEAADAD